MPVRYSSISVNSAAVSDWAIAHFRQKLKRQGYFHLGRVLDDFNHLEFAQKFGTVLPHKHNGEVVFSIKMNPELAERYPAFATGEVEPHTEGYEYEHTPLRYQCLWCVSPPTCGGGQTLLVDGYAFINSLSASEQDYITHNSFEFATPSGTVVRQPIYDVTSCETPIVRFNFSSLRRENDLLLDDIATRFLHFCQTTSYVIHWSKNDFLIWDNFRFLHSRTDYQDQNRELKRLYLK